MKIYKSVLVLVLALALFSCGTTSSDYIVFNKVVDFEGDYWNNLIDDKLHISGNVNSAGTLSSRWYDEVCDLAGEVFEPYPGCWQGAAISNYCSKDLQSDGNENRQLCAYVDRAYSGDNFLICNGFMDGVVELRFDSKRSYIGSMMVANTTYFYSVAKNGNHITPALGKNQSVWIEAKGYYNDSDEVQATAKFFLFENGEPVFEGWKKWYLTSMCKVDRIELCVKWNGEGEWMPYPAYFALDDIQVVRQEPVVKK